MGTLWDELKENPLYAAIAVLVIVIVAYFIRQRVTSSSTSDKANPLPGDQGLTNVPPTINNVYNTYPTVEPPPPTPNGTCKTGYTFHSGTADQAIPAGSYSVAGGYCSPDSVTPAPIPPPAPPPPVPPPKPEIKYFTVTEWPKPGSSLFSIAQIEHTSLSHIEALNPQIKNFDLVYEGQQVRVS